MVERIWLDVPYSHKEYAKKAGARWDPAAKRWYAPRPGMTTLTRWTPQPPAPAPPAAPPRTADGPPAPPAPSAPSRAGAGATAKAAQLARAERPRVLLVAGAGGIAGALVGFLLGHLLLALALTVVAATVAGLWQRGRGTAARWRMGATGERRTGRALNPLRRRGWAVLHDRQLGPRSRANVDHLLVSPDGTVWNVDSKMRSGAARYDRRRRYLRIGKTSGYQLVSSTLYESERIAQALASEVGPVQVVSVLAVHRAKLPPWHRIEIKGVRVMGARGVRRWLASQAGHPTARGREVAAATERLFPAYVQR